MTDTTMFGATDPAATETTIPVEGVRRSPIGAGVLPTERVAALLVFGALAFLVAVRGAFRGALGD